MMMMMMIKFVLTLVIVCFLGCASVSSTRLDLFSGDGRAELVQWAGYGEEKLSTVVIGGRLLCHSSAKNRSSSTPVSGALVAAMCGTAGKLKKAWAKSQTDNHGDFMIDVPSHLHAIPNLEKICRVKVVRIPRSSPCRHAACTGKIKRIEMASIGDGIRTYTSHDVDLMPHRHHT